MTEGNSEAMLDLEGVLRRVEEARQAGVRCSPGVAIVGWPRCSSYLTQHGHAPYNALTIHTPKPYHSFTLYVILPQS